MHRLLLLVYTLFYLNCDSGYREWPLEFSKTQDCETISELAIQKPDLLIRDRQDGNYYLKIREVGREIIGVPNTNFSWQSKTASSVTKVYQHNAAFTFGDTLTGFYFVNLDKTCTGLLCKTNNDRGCVSIYSLVNKKN